MASSSTDTDADADRFAELRAAVATIRQHNREQGRPSEAVSGHNTSDWRERAIGLFEGIAEFEEAVRHGAIWREEDCIQR
jgi:hypothetical protein